MPEEKSSITHETHMSDFVPHGIRIVYDYEPTIPMKIGKKILSNERLPKLPPLGSSMIDDFIVSKLDKHNAGDDVIQAFFDEKMPEKIKDYMEEVKKNPSN